MLKEAELPSATGDALQLPTARNEFEPLQIVVRSPGSSTATFDVGPYSGPGSAISRIELRRVEYVKLSAPSDASAIASGWMPDPLWPASFGKPEPLPVGPNQPFWHCTSPGRLPQMITAARSQFYGGETQKISVKLHIYDFTLPERASFDGNWNASFQALGGSKSLEATANQELLLRTLTHTVECGMTCGPHYNERRLQSRPEQAAGSHRKRLVAEGWDKRGYY
ncbi:MAG: hypothetical protein RMJ98_21610 [Myxococcales bacterium]|nr:hypothetical protein [Polyangiaceae bacterium]MDW8251901.1 hypothetical protein [Myxococcales bacterium]